MKTKPVFQGFLTCCFCLILAGCGADGIFTEEAPPLEGERISVLELQKSLEPSEYKLEENTVAIPSPWKNEFWPQAGGYPGHVMQNLDLPDGPLKRAWRADIGRGTTDELPLTAQPVLVDGRIFALDTDGRLSAFAVKDGKALWRTDVSDKTEDDPVIGGGIAFSDNTLFVTTGFNEILTVNPADGAIVWRASIPAPSRAAPTVMDGRVFAVTLDGRTLALDIRDGRVLWEYNGIVEDAGLVGAPAPAANNDIVVPAFSSGEVTALRVENGSVAWSDNLSTVRGFGGLSAIADIRAMPVIDRGLVFAVSFGGRLVAIDERTGGRIWQREIRGLEMPWIAGDELFILSAENQLIALARETGAIHWVTELPRTDGDDPVILTGPVLAGGRLIVAGSEGRVFEIRPETGEILNQWDAGNTISIAPVVAGGALYILTDDGTLSAWR